MSENNVPSDGIERLCITKDSNKSSIIQNKKDKNAKNLCFSANFDEIIGHIEDMLIDDKFGRLQESFLENHWSEFEDSEENKHSYMEIFINYTDTIEKFINNFLVQRIPHFNMDDFIEELVVRKGALEGEVFEILFTLTDFDSFKDLFLDYKRAKEAELDLSVALSVQPIRKG